jgi:hypothetical protein
MRVFAALPRQHNGNMSLRHIMFKSFALPNRFPLTDIADQ